MHGVARAMPVLALLGGCEFQHGMATPPEPPIPYCDPEDPDLVACYEMEGTMLDSSDHHLDATMNEVTFLDGRVGLAMDSGLTSAADVAENPALDISAFTFEAWISPSELPVAGARMGILDNQGQYGFFVHENGQLRCSGGGAVMTVDAMIAIGEWTHVACTYDGATLSIYVRGALLFTGMMGGPLSTTGVDGMSIAADNPPGAGSRFIGRIDQLRIMSRARTDAEICEDAGTCVQ